MFSNSGPGFKLCCGTKQIMETPNVFYTRGRCEECGAEADIRADGCNYMVILTRRR